MGYGCTKGLNNTNKSVWEVWSPWSGELVPHFLHSWLRENTFLCFHPSLKIRSASAKAQMLQFLPTVSSENFSFYPLFLQFWIFCLSGKTMCCFCCVPCDTKTNYFALPLIYPTLTKEHFSVSLKTKPVKMSIHKYLCSPQSENILLGIKW